MPSKKPYNRPSARAISILSLFLFALPVISFGSVPATSTGLSHRDPGPGPQRGIQTIVVDAVLNTTYHTSVNSTIEYVYQFTFNTTINRTNSFGDVYNEDIRVDVSTDSDDVDFPVLFVVRQQQSVLSWPLPVQSKIDRKVYQEASRTLCGEAASSSYTNDVQKTIFVSVSTASKLNVSFNIMVSLEQNFLMKLNHESTTDVAPLAPRFYRFVFPESHSRFVLLEVTSNDTSCMTVSVQNASCPILDQENNVQFEGYWQTMTTKAGMTLRKDDFPNGFYVVFVMHGDDSRCTKNDDNEMEEDSFGSELFLSSDRIKIVSFVVNEKITDAEYLAAIFGTVGIFLIFYVFSFIVSCAYLCRGSANIESPLEDAVDQNDDHNNGPAVSTVSQSQPILRETDAETLDQEPEVEPAKTLESQLVRHHDSMDESGTTHWLADSDSSLDETDIDMLRDVNRFKDIYRTSTQLCVAALSRKNPRVLAKKSQLYLWTLMTVAIFYALPVVQLVFTYQNVLHTTGNQDLCYYNYLCSHPLWLLSDFNHVYSNIGYIMLGILFLLLVLRRESMHSRLALQNPDLELRFGIPRHFGLFYAMGLALIMEGVLSSCYHVCPNHSNFQFDTCFMYVNAMLLMIKIYQTRHPDINASAYMAFAMLAIVVLLGVVGVLAGNIYFWVMFTILHVTVGLYLSIQIYYLGRWRLDLWIFKRIYNSWKRDCLASPLLCLKPLYIDRMILLIIANLSNWAIATFGLYRMSHDFASHLLLIFMVNLFLYTNFYIIMKLSHREKITFQPSVYLLLSVVFWSLSMYVFMHRSTSWQMTPAESRTFNKECLILGFYDTHDIWHFLSAASMFFSFMILLTLDDDLTFTPRTKIKVF